MAEKTSYTEAGLKIDAGIMRGIGSIFKGAANVVTAATPASGVGKFLSRLMNASATADSGSSPAAATMTTAPTAKKPGGILIQSAPGRRR